MTITTVGLQAEVITNSIRKVTQDLHNEGLLDCNETEIRYSEWKWLDTHLAVQEMLIQHARRCIAKKVDINYQATGLVREGKISDSRKQRQASVSANQVTTAEHAKAPRKPAVKAHRYKKSRIDVSINLDIQRNRAGDNT